MAAVRGAALVEALLKEAGKGGDVPNTKNKKRPRDEASNAPQPSKKARRDTEDSESDGNNDKSPEKKKERRKEEKLKRKEALTSGWEDIHAASAEKQKAYFWLQLAKTLKKELTALELGDEMDAKAFLTLGNKGPRSLPGLVADLRKLVPALSDSERLAKLAPQTPLVLVFTRAKTRCIDVARAMFQFGPNVRVGQLYAKHKKIEEQEEKLKQSPLHIAVGLPERMKQLVARGTLALSSVKLIVIDMEKDVKGYQVLDLNDTRHSFFRFYIEMLHQRVKDGKAKILLY